MDADQVAAEEARAAREYTIAAINCLHHAAGLDLIQDHRDRLRGATEHLQAALKQLESIK